MEITEIKSHIKNKSFNNFYIFSGSEWKIQRLYIDQIAKVSKKEIKYINSISDIFGKRNNNSFIQKSYIYVIRDDKEILQNEKVQSQISSIAGNNIIILLLTLVDKRLKFYKTYQDIICEFESLKPEILKKYIQKEISLSDKNCEKLMEICEYDYGRCLLEIDKIKQYAEGNPTLIRNIEDNAFEILLKEGIIYQPPKDAIFDFIDAVLDDEVNLAFNLYHQCLEVGEATMVMISVLYNNAKSVLQVQSYKGNNLEKGTGLTSWQIMNAKKHLNKRTIGDLLFIIEECQKSQQAIVTGEIEEEFIIENLLTRIL